MIDALPGRPLQRSEVEQLEDSDSLDGVYPVYDEAEKDMAYAAVLANNGELSAIAISAEGPWRIVKQTDVRDTKGGIPFDEMETLEELQNVAASAIGHSSSSAASR